MRVDPSIMARDWDFLALAERPIEEVRAALGVGPGGTVALGQDWRGPTATPRPVRPLIVALDRPLAALKGMQERAFRRDAFGEAVSFCTAPP
jgi:hypothetical protein